VAEDGEVGRDKALKRITISPTARIPGTVGTGACPPPCREAQDIVMTHNIVGSEDAGARIPS